MITEQEARETMNAIALAMANNDKPTREMLYADLDSDSLKRVLRWTMRAYIQNLATIAVANGMNPIDVLQMIAWETTKHYESN